MATDRLRKATLVDHAAVALHSFLFALVPPMVFLANSVKVVPLTFVDASRTLISVCLCNLALLILLSRWRGVRAGAVTLSWFYIAVAFYTAFLALASAAVPRAAESTWAITYLVVCVGAALWLGRPLHTKDQRHQLFNVISGTLFVVSSGQAILQISPPGQRAWDAEVAQLLAKAPVPVRIPAPPPDIYYLVLDGLGRPDVLRDMYGLDVTSEVNSLRALGWEITDRSWANYPQTYLALASALNGSYVDSVARAMDDSNDRRPLHELIQQSVPIASLKQKGYRFSLVGANMSVTARHRQADVCVCEWPGMNEFENALLSITPFRVLPLQGPTYSGQYRTVMGAFDALERAPEDNRPHLVFAHIVAPHPPFVVGENGEPTHLTGPVSYQDGDHYQGTTDQYRRGYRAQARFVFGRIVSLARKIDARGRAAVVVVHGDHGPGSAYSHRSLARSNLTERFGIFMGLKLGDSLRGVPDDLSPVNVLRLIFNARFGGNTPLLPNRSFYATWDEPYRLVEVRPE